MFGKIITPNVFIPDSDLCFVRFTQFWLPELLSVSDSLNLAQAAIKHKKAFSIAIEQPIQKTNGTKCEKPGSDDLRAKERAQNKSHWKVFVEQPRLHRVC